ncbi:threonine--tRNA ligase [Candidatus Fermentibacteria bacterium]|nr:threonine--tRNA ligase [Candidatus Fermentibacteria bacterium]
MRIEFPDGDVEVFEPGTTGMDVAESISRGLAKKALACTLDERLLDLTVPLPADGSIRILTFADDRGKEVLRHSAAHLMASAVKSLFPGTRLGIGPAIEDGFYYDMDIPDFPGSSALEGVEAEMRRQVEEDVPFKRQEMDLSEALQLFEELGETLKLELLRELQHKGETRVSVYRHGDFVDLCRGPHVPSTGLLRHFNLLGVAGAYWRGDERRQMLTRIYGTVFDSAQGLKRHLQLLEEARKRDHRKLGKELEMFTVGGEGGPGLAYWYPNGTVVLEELERHWKEAHRAAGYQLIRTPHIAPAELWQTSGHYDYYRDNMYFLDVEGAEYALKPMNCPGHMLIYRGRKRSYRELPMRLAELGTVYRYEKSGVLHGLMRVRGFTQDDAHIFCSQNQITDEIKGVVRLALYFLKIFDFGYKIRLSLMDAAEADHYAGNEESWRTVEPVLAQALEEMEEDYAPVTGEAAFYGPKIDIDLRDALGRLWQGPTIQFDFNLPERFDLTYVGSDGAAHRVLTIHRALYGSMERFVGCLIEHYAGNLPGWLAPMQCIILPITSEQREKALEVFRRLEDVGLRCAVDDSSETVGYRIRQAETSKVPFMLVIGEREVRSDMAALRVHGEGDRGSIPVDEAVETVREACRRPALPNGG